MVKIEKRLADLEAQAASTDHCVRLFFCDEGEDEVQARLKAGIPLDYAGKVVCVLFIESPNALNDSVLPATVSVATIPISLTAGG